MKPLMLVFVSAFLMSFVSITHARDLGEGLYLGSGLGKSYFKDDVCDSVKNLAVNCDDEDFSWKLFSGYQFLKHFALELSYMDMGEVILKDSNHKLSLDFSAITFDALGTLPVHRQLSLFGRLGLARWDADDDATFPVDIDDDDGFAAHIGLGAQFMPNDMFGLRFEWQYMPGIEIGDNDDFDPHFFYVSALAKFK